MIQIDLTPQQIAQRARLEARETLRREGIVFPVDAPSDVLPCRNCMKSRQSAEVAAFGSICGDCWASCQAGKGYKPILRHGSTNDRHRRGGVQ